MRKPSREQLAWNGGFFEQWFPWFCSLWALALLVTCFISWWVFAPTAAFGVAVLVLAIQPVPPAHAALVLRLGQRVVIGYFKDVKDEEAGTEKQERVSSEEMEKEEFDPNQTFIHRDYFTKGEGLRIVFPFIEALQIFSLERREKTVDAEDTFIKGGIAVIPEMLYVWRIKDVGRAIEFAVEKEEDVIAALTRALDHAVISGARTVFSLCDLEQAIKKMIPQKDVRGQVPIPKEEGETLVPIGNVILNDISALVGSWGVGLEAVRIRDVKPGKDAQDVFDQWESIRRAELKKQEDTTLAERDLAVRTNQAQAGLVEAQREAEGNRAKILALVGKKPDQEVTEADVAAYTRYVVELERARSLKDNTKIVVVPGTDLSRVVSGLAPIVTEVTKATGHPGQS